MHPAPSIIFFTVFSGFGFGLLAWLGLGMPNLTGWQAFFAFLVAFAAACGGLLAAAFHLANPKNAIKSFSQWRTSWLSREAWLSVTALVVMGIYALFAIFADTQITVLGWLGAALCLATVYSTSMIYAQLKSIPRWNSQTTSVLFLTLAVAGGSAVAGGGAISAALFLLTGAVQLWAWHDGNGKFQRTASIEAATGLGSIGSVRLFEPPHTGSNYLLDEMVYVVGRKHAQKLRIIAITLMSVLPAVIMFASASLPAAVIAVLLHLTGAMASRWLFFAEAEHVVRLYYGRT